MIEIEPGLARAVADHGKTGLHWAAELDQVDVARILIAAGADVEARTSWGASPFDWAATMGSARVADLLLERDATGLSLVTAAALGKRRKVEEWVAGSEDLSGHARRDAPSEPTEYWPADSAHLRGDVLSDALYAAARNGHAAVVGHLVERGGTVDAKGVFGGTALHWAAIGGHVDVVELLVRSGADVHVRDARFGATPLDWALEGGHAETADLLRSASEQRREAGDGRIQP